MGDVELAKVDSVLACLVCIGSHANTSWPISIESVAAEACVRQILDEQTGYELIGPARGQAPLPVETAAGLEQPRHLCAGAQSAGNLRRSASSTPTALARRSMLSMEMLRSERSTLPT